MVDSRTKITGIFGDPVAHSFSPVMQNAAFKAKGLNYLYLPFHVRREHLVEAVRAIISLEITGINVTAPHKEEIVPFLDELSPEAELLGAVNTVIAKNDRLKGFNTDIDGFLYLLQNIKPLSVQGERVCLLGAGGAARAVSLALARAKVGHLTILNRTVEKGKALQDLLCKNGLLSVKETSLLRLEEKTCQETFLNCAFIINSLSVDPVERGLFPGDGRIRCLKAAIDLRYSPSDLPFLKWASAQGSAAVNGLDMLLGQGTAAFEIFTGQKAPFQVMKEALRNKILELTG